MKESFQSQNHLLDYNIQLVDYDHFSDFPNFELRRIMFIVLFLFTMLYHVYILLLFSNICDHWIWILFFVILIKMIVLFNRLYVHFSLQQGFIVEFILYLMCNYHMYYSLFHVYEYL